MNTRMKSDRMQMKNGTQMTQMIMIVAVQIITYLKKSALSAFYVFVVLVTFLSACKNKHSEQGHENHIQDEGVAKAKKLIRNPAIVQFVK
jgi:hypothetical protein